MAMTVEMVRAVQAIREIVSEAPGITSTEAMRYLEEIGHRRSETGAAFLVPGEPGRDLRDVGLGAVRHRGGG